MLEDGTRTSVTQGFISIAHLNGGGVSEGEHVFFDDVLVPANAQGGFLFPQGFGESGLPENPLVSELLEVAGTLEIAEAAWLCQIGKDGKLNRVLAKAGAVPQAEIFNVVRSLSGRTNHPGAAGPLECLSGGRKYVVCAIGDQSVDRIVLFLRSLPSIAWLDLERSVARVQRLIYLGLSIGGMVTSKTLRNELPEVAALDLVDLCPFGILVMDLDKTILLANSAMSAFFDSSGLIGNFRDRFEIFNSEDAVRFHDALRTVLSAGRGNGEQLTMALTNGDARPILLSIARMAGDIGVPLACIIITDPAANYKVHIQPLAQVFALTPVEIRLVTQLVQGRSLKDAALGLKLKIETARTYLKQVFHKTGTHRQAELVALMKGGALPSLS